MSRILVVEDEPALLEVLFEAVTEFGHRATRAKDGDEGLRLARVLRPDLIVTGHMMPKRTGTELVLQLRADARFRRTPMLVMSSAPRPIALPDDVAFLRKPFDINLLEAEIADLLTERANTRAR